MQQMIPVCPISGKPTRFAFSAQVLGKYEAEYYRTDEGLLTVREPHWLGEAYTTASKAELDVGLVWRNLLMRNRVSALMPFLFRETGPCIDIGGGYGLFTRLM